MTDPVTVWTDVENHCLTSDLGVIDNSCFVNVVPGHCPEREFCAVFQRPPGPRILYGSSLSSHTDEVARSMLLEEHGVRIDKDLVVITATHVPPDGGPNKWVYRLLPVRWRIEDDYVDDTAAMLGVWAD